MEKVVEFINVSKNFKKRNEKKLWFGIKHEKIIVLNDITFSVKKGELVAIIGKNGSGKSTLLKILNGVYKHNSGVVKVNKTTCGLLDSHIGFNKDLSGYDNIIIQGKIFGIPVKKIKKHIDEIAEFAEITDFLYTPLKHYSNGMIARLTFSVVTLSNADILLFDEVLAFGDIHFQQKAYQYIKSINSKGKTIFIASHSLLGLVHICNRFILLDNGKIISDGTPAHVILKYYEQAFYVMKNQNKVNNFLNEIIELRGIKITNTSYFLQENYIIFNISVLSEIENTSDFDIGLLFRDFNGNAITTVSLKKSNTELLEKINKIIFYVNYEFINIAYLMVYPFIVHSITNEYKLSPIPLVLKIDKHINATDFLNNTYSMLGLINIPVKIELS